MIELFRVAFILTRYRIWSYLAKYHNSPLLKFLGICEFAIYPLCIKSENFSVAIQEVSKKLGPIYIKMGQTLSTRPDVIGQDAANILSHLQDSLPAFSYDSAVTIIKRELGKEVNQVFSSVTSEPVAAASIAQVHKAVLINGDEVAIKIMRPNIKMEYSKDIKFFAMLSKFGSKIYPNFRLIEIVEILEKNMKQELDFRIEAASYSEMRDNFINDKSVYIPKVYWDITSSEILVTEWIYGISIYDHSTISNMGLDAVTLSRALAMMFFNQSYRDGFFHADMHPGNIFVTYDGRIALVDFGIMGRLCDKDRFAVAEIILAITQKNYKAVAKLHKKAGYIPDNADIELFAQRCRAIFEPITGMPLKHISLAKLLSQICILAEECGMAAQPQLILLQKSMVIIEGIGLSLNPDINMWNLIEPWIKKWASKNISPEAKLLRAAKYLIDDLMNRLT